jgi:hypothetical protein
MTLPAILHRLRRLALGSLLAGAVLAGCKPAAPVPLPEPLLRNEALARYNRNVLAIGPLRGALAQWEARFVDPDGTVRHEEELGGNLIYRPPAEPAQPPRFYLQANAPLKKALVVGSNPDEYWVYSEWGEFGAWGRYENIGKPCNKDVRVHPLTFLEFLGLRPVPTDPLPAYKILPNDTVIEFIGLSDQGYSIQREIRLDRRTFLPTRITAFDPAGRPLLISELSDYKTVGDALLPTRILLTWPQDDSFLRLHLTGLQPDPRDRSALFRRPRSLPDVPDYQQIDKDCP